MNQQLDFTEEELKSIRAEFCKGFTDDQFRVCVAFCRLRGLMPGKHIVFSLRKSWEWDDTVGAKIENQKIVFITTIDAARLIAQRSKEYTGQGPEQYIYLDESGSPSIISEIPLPDPKNKQIPREPWAVRTTVYRKSFDHPITSVARFDAYAVTRKLKSGELVLTDMWQRRSPEMLAKCSEMLSLRKGYPEELSSLYLDLEMKPDADETPAPQSSAVTPASVVPLPPTVPQVNQAPAQPTETPRPNEQEKVSVVYHADSVPATLPAHSGSVLAVKESAPEKSAIEAAKAAVPELKPASELPEPKKRGRKPKDVSPENGRNIPAEGGITDADIADAAAPRVEPDPAENKQEAEQFVADLDPTPNPEEMKGFTTRVRALTAKGMKSDEVKAHVLKVGGTDDTKKVTVAAWNKALSELENPKKEAEA